MCKDARNYASVCVCVGALCENSREKEKDLRRANTAKATNDDHHDEAQRKKSEEPREKERKRERRATKYFLSTL